MDKFCTSKKKKNPVKKEDYAVKGTQGTRFIEILSPNEIPEDMRPPEYEKRKWEDDFDVDGLDIFEEDV